MDQASGQKVVLVTGTSSGIGAAVARRLASDGCQVYGTSRHVETPAADGVTMVPLDVTSDESVEACLATVLAQAGRIDVLINNAGYLLAGAIEEVTIDQARGQFETNFFGIVRMVKAVLPMMRRQRNGLIVNVSSLAGTVPMPFWGFYNASKFAVEGYTETLRYELRPFGIHVALVEPGAIKTPFYAQTTTAAMADYSPWRDRALVAMKQVERKAPGPERVADTVSRIVKSQTPRLRHRVTVQGRMLPLVRRLVPGGAFESAVRLAFHLDR